MNFQQNVFKPKMTKSKNENFEDFFENILSPKMTKSKIYVDLEKFLEKFSKDEKCLSPKNKY